MDFSYIDRMKEELNDLRTTLGVVNERRDKLSAFIKKEVDAHETEGGEPTTSPVQITYMGMQYDAMTTAISALTAYNNVLETRIALDDSLKDMFEKASEAEADSEVETKEDTKETAEEKK